MTKKTDPQLYASGYERKPGDRYWTTPWMVGELIRFETPVGPVWEPAAGRGDIVKAIHQYTNHGVRMFASDVDLSEFDETLCPRDARSFFDYVSMPRLDDDVCRTIITNPPYSLANKFIRHGLGFMDSDLKFMAMLLRSEYKSGKSRADIFGECFHYFGEIVLTTRPRWDYGDPDRPEDAAPRTNFSWFMWSKNYRAGRFQRNPIQKFSYMPRGFRP